MIATTATIVTAIIVDMTRGRFTCYVERGRVVDIDYSGLDQWR